MSAVLLLGYAALLACGPSQNPARSPTKTILSLTLADGDYAGGRRRAGRDVIWRGLGVESRRPASPEFWRRALADAGFRNIGHRRVTAGTGLLAWGTSPVDNAVPA